MIQSKISQGSLLYHSAHGLCRVKEMIQQKAAGEDVLFYALEPKEDNRMKMRFMIPASGMDASGFHSLISAKQANGILQYFQNRGAKGLSQDRSHETLCLAEEILAFSSQPKAVKDQRNRQRMERSVKGLVGELSIVLKTSLREMSLMIQKCLGDASKINPCILSALKNIREN